MPNDNFFIITLYLVVKAKLTGMEASEHLRLAHRPSMDDSEDEDKDHIFAFDNFFIITLYLVVKAKLTGMEASEHLRLAHRPSMDDSEDGDEDHIFSKRGDRRKSKHRSKTDLQKDR